MNQPLTQNWFSERTRLRGLSHAPRSATYEIPSAMRKSPLSCRPILLSLLVLLHVAPGNAAPEAGGKEATWPVTLAREIEVGGLEISPESPPRGLKTDAVLGVTLNDFMRASLLHYKAGYRADDVRAVKTPSGDYLAVVVSGEGTANGKGHYGPPKIDYSIKENDLIAYRSSDKGKTWSGPDVLFPVPYSMHGFVPLIPRGSKRIYCFGTEPVPALREGRENAPIAFRHSDDDGRTWSQPTIIRPQNDPDFKGMSIMPMTETASGAWLIGSHDAKWEPGAEKLGMWKHLKRGRLATRQYLLRSEDQGKTWTLLPGPRPNGWFLADYNRMEESTPLSLGGGHVLMLCRTAEGHLWEMRSEDDGKTWSGPRPTPIVHPDAPAMFFALPDGTLVVFHHNAYDPANPHFNGALRNQLWCALSKDQGRTWSEPRFVMASANQDRSVQVSYIDMLADDGQIHLFVPYGWRQTLHVRFSENDFSRMPTRDDLAARLPQGAVKK